MRRDCGAVELITNTTSANPGQPQNSGPHQWRPIRGADLGNLEIEPGIPVIG